ncbi:MAG: sigma-70 family RNA polymerase sigma factor [Planctomycetota bacterium]
MCTGSSNDTFPGGARQFATTHWSVVLAAGRGDSPQARDALGRLCQAYWYPLYAYARRQGSSAQDAQDLTQEFFARLLEKDGLAGVAGVARFRAYLLAAFKHFLSNERDRAQAQKRGGAVSALSLDARDAESRYSAEPSGGATPEKLFERRWALELLDRALVRVEGEYNQAGKRELFEALQPCLAGGGVAQAQIAAELKLSEGAVKVAAHRLRRRYREVLRAEIGDTVAQPGEIEDELRVLMGALSSG